MQINSNIITLCGSTKFKKEYDLCNFYFTMKGFMVFSCGFFPHSDSVMTISEEEKLQLDKLHKQKIIRSDAVMIINVDNYIGESTKSELDYAIQSDIFKIYFWEYVDNFSTYHKNILIDKNEILEFCKQHGYK